MVTVMIAIYISYRALQCVETLQLLTTNLHKLKGVRRGENTI